jgi:hypothetical protein
MARHLLFGLFFLLIFSCKSNDYHLKQDKPIDTTLKFLTYGLPDREQQRAMNVVAKCYGFHYYPVGNCVIPQSLADSVSKENQKVNDILEQRFGKRWRLTFAAQVDTMQKLQHEVEKLVKKERYIVKKEEELNKEDDGLEFLIDPTDRKNIFTVKVYGWGKLNGQNELMIYYKLTVDLDTKTITKNSSTAERLYNRS